FRLYTPFVPGTVRSTVVAESALESPTAAQSQSDLNVLKPIEDYLDATPASPPSPPPYVQAEEDLAEVGEFEEEPDELPPVEHFIDSLPGADEFAGAFEPGSPGNGSAGENASAPAAGTSESGWGETDWQHYDWRAAAALGESANQEASSAWAATDWDGSVPTGRELRNSAAHRIATALDEIAQ